MFNTQKRQYQKIQTNNKVPYFIYEIGLKIISGYM